MKTTISYLTLIIILIFIISCKDNKEPNNKTLQKTKFALVVHGGAGSITKGKYSIEKEKPKKLLKISIIYQ